MNRHFLLPPLHTNINTPQLLLIAVVFVITAKMLVLSFYHTEYLIVRRIDSSVCTLYKRTAYTYNWLATIAIDDGRVDL